MCIENRNGWALFKIWGLLRNETAHRLGKETGIIDKECKNVRIRC